MPSVLSMESAKVHGVCARDPEKTARFAKAWEIPRVYRTAEEMMEDPKIEIVYVATPNALHACHAAMALRYGKHVLVEKPFTVSEQQARYLQELAQKEGRFLMEAMWTRFFPATERLLELTADNAIGTVHNIRADFSFSRPYREGMPLYTPELGGGMLLDGGCYPLAFASMIYGRPPVRTMGLAEFAHGVDVRANVVMEFAEGGLASLFCGGDTPSAWDAVIFGETGKIEVPQFHAPSGFVVTSYKDGTVRQYSFPYPSGGYQFEFQEVMHCVEQGYLESPRWPLRQTVERTGVLERQLRAWGLQISCGADGGMSCLDC